MFIDKDIALNNFKKLNPSFLVPSFKKHTKVLEKKNQCYFIISKKKVLIDKRDKILVESYHFYLLGNYVYTREKIKGKTICLSRLILDQITYDNNFVVDHINRNTLDNRRKNLRITTHSENYKNSKRLAYRYKYCPTVKKCISVDNFG